MTFKTVKEIEASLIASVEPQDSQRRKKIEAKHSSIALNHPAHPEPLAYPKEFVEESLQFIALLMLNTRAFQDYAKDRALQAEVLQRLERRHKVSAYRIDYLTLLADEIKADLAEILFMKRVRHLAEVASRQKLAKERALQQSERLEEARVDAQDQSRIKQRRRFQEAIEPRLLGLAVTPSAIHRLEAKNARIEALIAPERAPPKDREIAAICQNYETFSKKSPR